MGWNVAFTKARPKGKRYQIATRKGSGKESLRNDAQAPELEEPAARQQVLHPEARDHPRPGRRRRRGLLIGVAAIRKAGASGSH